MSLHAHERAVCAGLDDDVLELADFGQASGGAHAELVHLICRRRLRADRAGGDLHVLLAQRVGHVAGRQAAAGQPVRIEPQPHREAALAEDDDVADARHALQRVADVAIEVVADEQRVVAVVVGVEADARRESRPMPFVTVMPLVRTSSGMRPSAEFTRFCTSTAARSGSRPTSNVTVIVAEPAVRARRGHVDHALDAVDDRSRAAS